MPLPTLAQMFRPTQQVAPVQNQQPNPNPGNPQDKNMQIQQHNAGNPNPTPTNDPSKDSPLDPFKDLWKTDPNAKPPTNVWDAPILPSDPVKIREAAGKMDMMQGIDPALIQKVQAGGDTAALMDLMNRVAQNTLVSAAQLTTSSVEHAGRVVRDRTRQELPDTMRNFQLDNLPVENPVLKHPGAQGMLKMARQQIQMTNPGMSAVDIDKQAQTYLLSFAQAATAQEQNPEGTAPVQLDRTGSPVQDWESWLNT